MQRLRDLKQGKRATVVRLFRVFDHGFCRAPGLIESRLKRGVIERASLRLGKNGLQSIQVAQTHQQPAPLRRDKVSNRFGVAIRGVLYGSPRSFPMR